MHLLDKIKFAVFLPCYAFRTKKATQLYKSIQNTAHECEQLGYHSVWLDDHLMIEKTPTLECWTTLSALSTTTETIRLGTMVTCNSFRNPALLAKMAATIDHTSNGRLELGIGAGIQKNEHTSYGYPFPSSKTRIERLNEATEIIKKMWTEKKASYNGKHYTIINAVCEPKPLQKPHPPIIIGGGGEKLTLKVAAQHANRFDWGYLPSIEDYKRKLKILEKQCEAAGRNFHSIEKSCWPMGQTFLGEDKKDLDEKVPKWLPKGVTLEDFLRTNFVGTPEDCIKQIRPYMNLGVKHFMLFFGDLPDLSGLRLFAEKVAPKIK